MSKNKTDNPISKQAKPTKQSVSNPMSKQLNALRKNVAEKIAHVKTKSPNANLPDTSTPKTSNPITSEISNIVARINHFNTTKTSNKMYSGYMNAGFHKVIDFSELVYGLNSALMNKTSEQDLFTSMHSVFSEKLDNIYTAFGIYQEKSKCINLKLFSSMGNTYMSKVFLSEDENPVIQAFNTGKPIYFEDNSYLKMPYIQSSASLILPLNCLNGCKGVMIIGKDDLEDKIGLFTFISNYCALFIQNMELLEQANKYTNTDTLTGLYTHRGFQEILAAELKRAADNDTELSIIMLDVNNISKINRELGHAKGDEVIKLLAEKVKQNIRSTDKAGRYGGDEIAIILPNTGTADAKYLAEYITYCLSCCFVDDVGPVKVSVGITTFPEASRDQEKLLILAEQAMYISQAKGYKEGMSAIISSSDIDFWADDSLNSFAEVISKRHAQLGIDFEEELLHKFNNEKIISQNHLMELANSLAGAIDAKDPYTKGHSTSVSRYSEALARAINLPEEQVQKIKLGALLHDVGKIGIPENVLKKPDKLSDEEWAIMKQHPVIGAEKVLAPNEALRELIPMVKYHHEHIDGSGYPEKLKGDEIPLEAKIIAVADTYHALISDRPYRKGMSVEKACEILKDGAGKQWDSDLVRHFISIAPSLSTKI